MSKFNLILIGTLAIGMFALPGVVSTFSGSHEYIAPENVDCMKCHQGVYNDILGSIDNHTHAGYSTSGEEWTLDCVECHTVSGIGDNVGGGHAAQKVDCAFCHDNSSFSGNDYYEWAHNFIDSTGLLYNYDMKCDACHRLDMDLKEGMFLDDVFKNIVIPDAAHSGFFDNAVNSTLLLGPSEACVGCHTHVDFNMTEPPGGRGMTYDMVSGVFTETAKEE